MNAKRNNLNAPEWREGQKASYHFKSTLTTSAISSKKIYIYN